MKYNKVKSPARLLLEKAYGTDQLKSKLNKIDEGKLVDIANKIEAGMKKLSKAASNPKGTFTDAITRGKLLFSKSFNKYLTKAKVKLGKTLVLGKGTTQADVDKIGNLEEILYGDINIMQFYDKVDDKVRSAIDKEINRQNRDELDEYKRNDGYLPFVTDWDSQGKLSPDFGFSEYYQECYLGYVPSQDKFIMAFDGSFTTLPQVSNEEVEEFLSENPIEDGDDEFEVLYKEFIDPDMKIPSSQPASFIVHFNGTEIEEVMPEITRFYGKNYSMYKRIHDQFKDIVDIRLD